MRQAALTRPVVPVDDEITSEEVARVVIKIKQNKADGLDKISQHVLKAVIEQC